MSKSFDEVLKGCVLYFDVVVDNGSTISSATLLKERARQLGAKVLSRWSTASVTHYVWKDGPQKSLKRAMTLGVQTVSPLWVETCFLEKSRVAETAFHVGTDKVQQRLTDKSICPPVLLEKEFNINDPTFSSSQQMNMSPNAAKTNPSTRKRKRSGASEQSDVSSSPQRVQTQLPQSSTIKVFKRLRRRSNTEKNTYLAISSFSDGCHNALLEALRKLSSKMQLITEPNENFDYLVVERQARTMKVLLAIARGAWVLDSRWVFDSIESKEWCEPGPYEFSGFAAARTSRLAHQDSQYEGLFGGMTFYVDEKLDEGSMSVKELLLTAGARLSFEPSESDMIIANADVFERMTEKPLTECVVSCKWIFDSLEAYRRLETKSYVIKGPSPAEDDDVAMPDSPTF